MTENGESWRERLSAADWVLVGLFCIILAIILVAVFFRYVVNQSLFWSDEVVRYLFVWFTLLGTALVLRDRCHIRVEYFVEHMPRGLRRAVEVGGLLLILVFNGFLVVAGFLWVHQTAGTRTPALTLPLNWIFYAALPFTAALSCWFAVRRLVAGEYAELAVGQEKEMPQQDADDV
ncbi:MAG: TRAP transporter small permease [Planctomycetes bacterium]|nr:TRAP transporter small permease [Planctomycetota bacterium]